MANVKTSNLAAVTTPLAGSEVLPIVQSSTTKKVSVDNLTAGKAVSALSMTLSNGDLVIGTSGKGVDFTAAGGTILTQYQTGTIAAASLGMSFGGGTTGITYSARSGSYTQIGRVVIGQITIILSAKGSSTGTARITGLPVAVAANYAVNVAFIGSLAAAVTPIFRTEGGSTTNIVCAKSSGTGTASMTDTDFTNTTEVRVTFTYFV